MDLGTQISEFAYVKSLSPNGYRIQSMASTLKTKTLKCFSHLCVGERCGAVTVIELRHGQDPKP